MKYILIIGSCGYIGSYLQEELSKEDGYIVNGVDICWFSDPSPSTIHKDYKNLTEGFLNEYDVVILMAGHSSVKMCEGDPIHSFNNNVSNFVQLLSKLSPSTKFIYASSSSVYGKCVGIATENNNDFTPYNNYDITKHIIDIYSQKSNIEYYGLRFGTVNGYSPILRKDLMINSMYMSGVDDGVIKLYNKNIMRPILGIKDLYRGVKLIIDCEKDYRGIYNMCSFNRTAGDIAYAVGDIINKPVVGLRSNNEEINAKLQSTSYDFSIDTSKFENTFNYAFTETIESIVESLSSNVFDSSIRNTQINYE